MARFKKNPLKNMLQGKNNEEEENQYDETGQDSQDEPKGDPRNSLELYDIPQVIKPEDFNIITISKVKSVRFRESTPIGYTPAQVDEFLNTVIIPSIEWYEEAIFERNRQTTFLGKKLDEKILENENLKRETQKLSLDSNIANVIKSSESGVKEELDDAMKTIARLQKENLALQNNSQAPTTTGASDEEVAEYKAHISKLEIEIEAIRNDSARNTQELEEKLSTLDKHNEDLTTYAEQVKESYNALVSSFEELQNNYNTLLEELQNKQLSSGATADLEKEINELKTEIQSKEIHISQINETYTATQNTMQTRIEQLTHQLENAPKASNNEAEMLNLKKEYDTYIDEITSQVEKNEQELSTVKEKLSSAENELSKRYTEEQVETLKKDYDEYLIKVTTEHAEALQQTPAGYSEEQVNEIREQYDNHISVIEKMYEELTNRYDEDVQQLEHKYQQLEQTYSILKDNENGNISGNNELLKQYDEHIKNIEKTYEELAENYNKLLETNQQLEQQALVSGGNKLTNEEEQQYLDYIEDITEKYNLLKKKYTLLLNKLQESDEAAEAPVSATVLPIFSERTPSKHYSNLPPGIRPEDV